MKIYEKIKEGRDKTIKIFGLPIIKRYYGYMGLEKYQEFCGGLVSILESKDNNNSKKETKILNKSIIKRVEENNYRIYSFLGKECKKISRIDEFKKQYFKYFSKEHDDIYILMGNSGEIYLALTYLIDSLLKKNESKKPLFVATQKYHVDIINMICPDMSYVYIEKMKLNIVNDRFAIDNFRFFLLFHWNHFYKVVFDIVNHKLGAHHYFKSMLGKLEMSENDIRMRRMNIPHSTEQSMLEKVNKTGLHLDKFVFLAPEAQTCIHYDENFWVALIKKLQEVGYDVFVNLVGKDIDLNNTMDFKTCKLSFAEAFALAKRAHRIVSLRSGFTEFLLQTEVPIDVLYTKFKHKYTFGGVDSYHFLYGYGLVQLPFADIDKIREFNMFEISSVECLNKIIETLC